MTFTKISDSYAVCAQISPEHVTQIAAAGFVTIICNRPDNEEQGQPCFADIEAACKKVGLELHHVPVAGSSMPAVAVAEHRRIVDASDGPVLAYCRSGHRSAVIWQASA